MTDPRSPDVNGKDGDNGSALMQVLSHFTDFGLGVITGMAEYQSSIEGQLCN